MVAFTIMHLSDLHRKSSIFQNSRAFVSSIVSDIARFSHEGIPKPDIIVVCGDIVQGSGRLEKYEEAVNEIESQYVEAEDILNRLCLRIMGGNKNKIVIAPGNHDISWPNSIKSMQKLNDLNQNLVELLKHPESNIRWNWADFAFYQIKDPDVYKQRMLSFANFYNRFYDNKKQFSLEPEKQYSLFEYPEDKIVVVAFNSCFMTDHLNSTGRIHPECIANCYDYIGDSKFNEWLKIAVWHHDIYGIPNRADFLDERTVQFLIDKGFNLGLHGHLHKNEVCKIKFSADQITKIPVFGCGSLSASPQANPGVPNQYNILQINDARDHVQCYLRIALGQPSEMPIWTAGSLNQEKDKNYIVVKIERGRETGTQLATETSFARKLVEIEDMMAKKVYNEALQKLKNLDQANSIVRRFTVECLWQLDKDEELIDFIKEPRSIMEFGYLAESLWRKGDMANLGELVEKTKSIKEFSESEIFKRAVKRLSDKGSKWNE